MNSDSAGSIFQAGVEAVLPSVFMPAFLDKKELAIRIGENWFQRGDFRRLVLLAMGKAASAMALEAKKMLGDWVDEALVVTKHDHALAELSWPQLEAGHPVPDDKSFEAGARIRNLVGSLQRQDLLLVLLSGGASALVADLPGGCSQEELQQFYQSLLASGASISEMNAVRKHFSLIKGGQLARLAGGATIEAGVLSDVPGDDLSVIASGPFFPDNSSIADVEQLLYRFGITEQMPVCMSRHFEKLKSDPLLETPKPGDPLFDRVRHHLLATNQLALQACADKALALGYEPIVFQAPLEGEARELGLPFLQQCISQMEQYKKAGDLAPRCFLAGGETTVTLTGSGKGGRNQELILSVLVNCLKSAELFDQLNSYSFAILSGGTDGTDGPTDAAGAVLDEHLLNKIRKNGPDPQSFLTNQDAYTFFSSTGGLVKTGPTQTNVMDLLIILLAHKAPAHPAGY
jgi:hydroxypyruvate reductase